MLQILAVWPRPLLVVWGRPHVQEVPGEGGRFFNAGKFQLSVYGKHFFYITAQLIACSGLLSFRTLSILRYSKKKNGFYFKQYDPFAGYSGHQEVNRIDH